MHKARCGREGQVVDVPQHDTVHVEDNDTVGSGSGWLVLSRLVVATAMQGPLTGHSPTGPAPQAC